MQRSTGHCGLAHPGGRCPALHGQIRSDTGSVFGLTTAHLNHTHESEQETKPMARISVKIAPLHPDGTECTHAVRPSGKPRDAASGCVGRRNYAVVCSACGPVGEPHGLRVLAEPAQSSHRDSHKAALAPASH